MGEGRYRLQIVAMVRKSEQKRTRRRVLRASRVKPFVLCAEDYPFFLSKEPRFTIFREDIGLVDATCTFGRNRDPDNLIDGDGGYVMARGLNHYKRVFKVIRTIMPSYSVRVL